MDNQKANVLRVQALRRSSAAQPIPAKKVRRERTRATAKRAAVRDAS